MGGVTGGVGIGEGYLAGSARGSDEADQAGARAAQHVGEGLNHVYPMSPTPEGRRAREEIIRIITGSPAVENRQPDQTDQTGTARTPAVTE